MNSQFPFHYPVYTKQDEMFAAIDVIHKHESPEDRENRYKQYFYFKNLKNKIHEFFCVPRSGIKKFIESYIEKANNNETLNIYELLTEGSVCKIYFDLEQTFEKNTIENETVLNNKIDGNEKLFNEFLVDVKKYFNPYPDGKPETTCMVFNGCRYNKKGDYKWSYHVILTNAQYKDNSHAMKDNVNRFYEKYSKYSKFSDTAVYTKNRVFRMWLSSKGDDKRLEFDELRSSSIYKDMDKRNLFFNSFISMNPDYKTIDTNNTIKSSSSTSSTYKRSHSTTNVDPKHKKIILDFLKKNGNDNVSFNRTWVNPKTDSIGISTNSKHCMFVKRPHLNNNTYFMIYNPEESCKIYFKCHDEMCKNRSLLIYPTS